MMRDYAVRFKKDGTLVGVFRAFDEYGAIKQAFMRAGSASLFSGPGYNDFVAIKIGLL